MLNYKSKHVFGPEANVDGALSIGKIDPFDILFLDEGKIGWITENGEKFIIDDKKQVRIESELPSVGEENVLFVCKESLYIWNGSEYILIVDDYATLKDRVSKLENSIAANTSAIELLTNGASAKEVDSVNDLIQYVNEHGSEVTGMKADIKANADALVDKLSYNEQTLTEEQKAQARVNIGVSEEISDDEFIAWLNEESIVSPVATASGELYVTNNNEIYVL